jgi:hypothetical protein
VLLLLDGEEGIFTLQRLFIEVSLLESLIFLEVSFNNFRRTSNKATSEKFGKRHPENIPCNEEMKVALLMYFPKTVHPMGNSFFFWRALTAFNPKPLTIMKRNA